MIKSKIRKKKKAAPKGRYLPITNDGAVQASDEEYDGRNMHDFHILLSILT